MRVGHQGLRHMHPPPHHEPHEWRIHAAAQKRARGQGVNAPSAAGQGEHNSSDTHTACVTSVMCGWIIASGLSTAAAGGYGHHCCTPLLLYIGGAAAPPPHGMFGGTLNVWYMAGWE